MKQKTNVKPLNFKQMEKKIERVPYISKWYKEEQKDELLNFAFDEQNTSSDWNIDKFSLYDKNLYTYSTNTTNGLLTTGYSKPTVQLKFEHHLTQKDVDYLRELIRLTRIDIESIKHVPSKESDARYRLGVIENYIRNAFGIRDKAQEKQLEELIEKSKLQKSYGTLGEHWRELMDLFDVKAKKGKDWKRYFDKCIDYIFFDTDQFKFVDKKIKSVANILGIEFIIDFVKACEKCED